MPSLADLVPEIAAYQQQQALGQQRQAGQLAQVGALQGILAKVQEQQEMAQLKGVMSQSGGDPAKAVQALLQSGSPKAIALAAQLKGMLPKPAEDRVVAPGGAIVKPDGSVVYQAPFKPDKPDKGFAPPEFLRLQEAAEKYPAGHPLRVQIEARLKMMQERPPGTVVNMPSSSDTMKGEDGKYYKVRIGKDGKMEAIPLQVGNTPLSPPPTAADKKATSDKLEDEQSVAGIRARINKMGSLIQGGSVTGGVVGPQGAVARVAETGIGIVDPAAKTPALDYDNEKSLLLAEVRKMVEKDANLSNQERATLTQTLGGGLFQTPGSAARTLNNVLNYVEQKRIAGAGRQEGNALERQVKTAGWDYEPNKYEYRVVDGKVQRKAK